MADLALLVQGNDDGWSVLAESEDVTDAVVHSMSREGLEAALVALIQRIPAQGRTRPHRAWAFAASRVVADALVAQDVMSCLACPGGDLLSFRNIPLRVGAARLVRSAVFDEDRRMLGYLDHCYEWKYRPAFTLPAAVLHERAAFDVCDRHARSGALVRQTLAVEFKWSSLCCALRDGSVFSWRVLTTDASTETLQGVRGFMWLAQAHGEPIAVRTAASA